MSFVLFREIPNIHSRFLVYQTLGHQGKTASAAISRADLPSRVYNLDRSATRDAHEDFVKSLHVFPPLQLLISGRADMCLYVLFVQFFDKTIQGSFHFRELGSSEEFRVYLIAYSTRRVSWRTSTLCWLCYPLHCQGYHGRRQSLEPTWRHRQQPTVEFYVEGHYWSS